RAAIKDPAELVYLFLCIGIGLALGAAQPWIAIALVIAATVFVLVFDRWRPGAGEGDAFVTVIGPAVRFEGDGPDSALAVVRRSCRNLMVQRCEIDGDEGQLRVQLRGVRGDDAQQLVGALRAELPGCHVSYVDAGVLA
ncbi:MAG: hypothetical protein KAI24_02590, partial [Planctomycetes bacterium]|nr:hypothetical protein [Planctomycetota bacterium]